MNVTGLKAQIKNSDRVNVFLDGKYSFSLTLDQLLESGLKKGSELNDGDLAVLKKLSADGKMRARALEWVMNRPRSLQEFREYCYRRKIDTALSDAWQSDFQTKKYLDEERFADWFAEMRVRKLKSKRSVVQELMSKGITRSLAENVVSEKLQKDDDSLTQLIHKLQNRSRYQDEKKLIAYLIGKGFAYQDIKLALSQARAGAERG